MTDLANLVVTLTAETSQYTAGLQKATQSVQKFSKDTTEALDTIKGGLATLAEAFAIEKVVEFAQDMIDANAALVAFSASTGIAVDALSQLEGAAKVNNVQNFDQALTHLEKSIGAAESGSQSAIAAFKSLGITTEDLTRLNGDTEAALKLVSDRFATFADGIGKSAVAQTIFGRNTSDTIHFLDQGSESIAAFQKEIDQLGGTVGGELAHNSEEFNSNISKLGIALKGVANEALAQILPDLIEYSNEMVQAAKSTDVLNTASQAIVIAFRVMESGLSAVVGAIKAVNDVKNDVPGAAKELASSLQQLRAPDFSGFKKFGQDISTDIGSTVENVTRQWNGYYKFLAEQNAAVAAQTSNVASVRQGALAGVADVNDQITRSLTDLSGQTLAGFRDTDDVIQKSATETAAATSSAFKGAFASTAAAAQGAAQQIQATFAAASQGIADLNRQSEAAGGAAPKPQVSPLPEGVQQQLENFDKQLSQEIATFGKGSNAAREYSLAHGAIAEAIDKVNKSTAAADPELQALIAHIRGGVATLNAFGQAQDVKRVQEFIAGLQGEVETFDQGSLAAQQYAVQHGKLADQLALTGKRADEFKAQILQERAALSALQDDKAIQILNNQMLELTGSTAQAAKNAFALQNAVLAADIKNRLALPVTGNTDAERAASQAAHDKAQADQDALDAAKALNATQADANQLLLEYTQIQAKSDALVQQIQLDVADGNKTTLDGQAEISAARQQEQDQLQHILDQLNAIPGANKLPGLVDSITKATTTAKGLSTEINALSNTIRTDFVDASTQAFGDFVTGTKSASDAFLEFVTDIEKELVNLIAKNYFEQLFSGAGAGGGAVSFLSGLFGGSGAAAAGASSSVAASTAGSIFEAGFERGGPVEATGRPALVGEAGPELFVPDEEHTPASSITRGGTAAPSPADIPESAYLVGLRGPEVIRPDVRGVIVTHQKVLEAVQPRAPETEPAPQTQERAESVAAVAEASEIRATPPAEPREAEAVQPIEIELPAPPVPARPAASDRPALISEIRAIVPAIAAAPATEPSAPVRQVEAPAQPEPPQPAPPIQASAPEVQAEHAQPEPLRIELMEPRPAVEAPAIVQSPLPVPAESQSGAATATVKSSPDAELPAQQAVTQRRDEEGTAPAAPEPPPGPEPIAVARMPELEAPRESPSSPVLTPPRPALEESVPARQVEPQAYQPVEALPPDRELLPPLPEAPTPAPIQARRGEPMPSVINLALPLPPSPPRMLEALGVQPPAPDGEPQPLDPNVIASSPGDLIIAAPPSVTRHESVLEPGALVDKPAPASSFLAPELADSAPDAEAVASALPLPTVTHHEISVATDVPQPYLPPRREEPVPLVEVPDEHEAVLVHTEKVIRHEAAPQRLLDPHEYEALLTDRYLEKRAGGGPTFAGKPYLVGEDGPELFVPPVSGTVMNAQSSWGRKVTINQTFAISAPTGSVSKATQVQVGAAASRSAQAAAFRNN